ncbi:MAG: hypothetical protein IJ864_05360 [Alphaproteobacteria bacterium]|nr:hypothetical protein [Alphaproteobacteria bacterium]
MFSRNKKTLWALTVLVILSNPVYVCAEETTLENVNAASLPINVANQKSTEPATVDAVANAALVSPSQAQAVKKVEATIAEETAAVETVPQKVEETLDSAKQNIEEKVSAEKVITSGESTTETTASTNEQTEKVANDALAENQADAARDDFDFDLKMKAVTPGQRTDNLGKEINDADMPQNIQYKTNPVENLSNSVLSQIDDDLFSQMSAIEKSTTLLTLELRREKIRNEIEAQKAIRIKNAEEIERQKNEERLKNLEREKQIEAQVLREKQILVDKEKMFEVLKQRKLINAYMNQMLLMQQDWLKEKEALYNQINDMEQEKRDVIASFKQKLDTVLEASAKNIQAAEAARANFERIVKGLKARNEQLRKRIEADALIIRNAKSSLYLKTQSIEELKDKNAAMMNAVNATTGSTDAKVETAVSDQIAEENATPYKLSSEYAILGIKGQSGNMSVDIIDLKGQSSSLKVGSPLPTGHVVSEIGSDYVRFSRDGRDDYLYVGKTIDGIVPTLGLLKDGDKK